MASTEGNAKIPPPCPFPPAVNLRQLGTRLELTSEAQRRGADAFLLQIEYMAWRREKGLDAGLVEFCRRWHGEWEPACRQRDRLALWRSLLGDWLAQEEGPAAANGTAEEAR